MKIFFILTILFFSTSLFSLDFSGDEMSFDSDEIKTTMVEQPEARKLLEMGKKKYKAKRYRTAANYFYKVISNEEYAASYDEANFNMAKSMRKLEFYYLTLYYLDKAIVKGETSPFFNASLKYFTNLSKKISNEKILSNISKYDPKNVPKKYKDTLYYLAGKYNYQKGNFPKAVRYLKLIPETAPDYLKSIYILSVIYARLEKTQEAVNLMKIIIDYNGEVFDKDLFLSLREMAIIAVARIYYQQKEYDKSILYFNKIPRFSQQWLDGVFESSWAYLMKGDYAKALGNLVTLRSPSFYKAFYPEKYFIEAVIYYNNCDYKTTKKIIKGFLKEYRPLRKSLKKLIKANPDPYKFYKVMKKAAKETKDPRLKWIFSIALTDKRIKKGFQEKANILAEIDKIKASPKKSFLRQPMTREFFKILKKEKKLVEKEIGNTSLKRFKRVVNKIRKLMLDVKIIRQVMLEIREKKITKELISLKVNKDEYFELDKEKIIMSTPGDHIYWPFEGEYWKDELGYYLYPIKSQCKK